MRHLFAILATAALLAACSDGDRAARRKAAGEHPGRADFARVASASAGARVFGQCAACHPIRRGALDRDGPNLFGVVGAPVAGNSRRFAYTHALRSLGGRWTPERLDAWLAAPPRFAPGTSMSFPGLRDPLDRADVIAYLESQR